jgi:hypothetical protein
MVSFRISQQMYRGRKPTEYQYIYNKIAIQWLKTVFIPYTQPKDDQWRVLIVDGHKTYTNVKFMELCIKSKIYLIFLYRHISHVCQPNDLEFFSHL